MSRRPVQLPLPFDVDKPVKSVVPSADSVAWVAVRKMIDKNSQEATRVYRFLSDLTCPF